MRITELRLHPIAVADPPLRSSYGRHAPYALRTVVELKSTDGLTGFSETYGGEKPLAALAAARARVEGMDPFQLLSLKLDMTNNMEISDFSDLRDLDEIVDIDDPTDYVEFIIQMIHYYKKKHGDRFTVFTMDSLGALYSLMEDSKGMRKRMYHFFKTLRDYNLISFIVMERTPGAPSEMMGNEGFLVDGIIELGLDRSRGKLVRFVRVEKMRACDHSMESHTMEVGEKGITVLGPTLA